MEKEPKNGEKQEKEGKGEEKRAETGENGENRGQFAVYLGLCEALRTLVLVMQFVCSLPISGLWISQFCVPKILLAMWQGHWRRR